MPEEPTKKPNLYKPRMHKSIMHNRVQTLMIHAPRYAFQRQARLAQDAGVSRSTISRLIAGRNSPTLRLEQSVTDALAKHLQQPLTPADLFSQDGSYREPSACTLCGCHGCLPDAAYDRKGNRRPEWKNARPGDWSRSLQTPSLPEHKAEAAT